MFSMDHFDGSFEGFETEMTWDGKVWTAKGLGVSVSNPDQGQALNDLNEKIYNGISNGEIVPNMGN